MINIIYTISSIDHSNGGPSKSVSDLSSQIAKNGLAITVLTKKSPNPYLTSSPHQNLKLLFTNKHSISKTLKNLSIDRKIDLLHGHGIWQMPVHHMSSWAREIKLPYVISPRGMLEPWSLEQSKLKKKLAFWFYQYRDIANASCIHATSQMESGNISKLGFTNPIAVIPNGN